MSENLEHWLAYFKANQIDDHAISWHLDETLSAEELSCIKNSIAKFQLGENSEGKGLMKFAKVFAEQNKSETIIEITTLFIKEEQRHSLLLRRFMETHAIPLTRKSWTDTVFRRLRKNVNYETSITILITAELIALSYYKCLARSTNSRVLQQICQKIDREEVQHVKYESEILSHIRNKKSVLKRLLAFYLHGFLFFGTVLVVYLDHRKVIHRGKSTLTQFWQCCWHDYSAHFKFRKTEQTSHSEVTARINDDH